MRRSSSLDPSCQGFSRRRLMDLGFTPGARLEPALQTFVGDPRGYRVRGTLVALRQDQARQVMVRPAPRDAERESGAGTVSAHNCETCPAHAQLEQMGLKVDRFDRVRRARRKSEHRQVDAVQRADRAQAAHRQLARQDGHARRRRLRVQPSPLQARRPAGHLLAAVGVAGRGDRARLPAVRRARLHDRRRRRDGARAQPQSGAAGARDHRQGGPGRQPDGRSAAQGHRSRRAHALARPRRAGGASRRAHRRGPVTRCSRRSKA